MDKRVGINQRGRIGKQRGKGRDSGERESRLTRRDREIDIYVSARPLFADQPHRFAFFQDISVRNQLSVSYIRVETSISDPLETRTQLQFVLELLQSGRKYWAKTSAKE